MDFNELSLILDFGFACLLVIVLIYAVRLNNHIKKLQDSKAELEKLLQGFVIATERAETAIEKLKSNSQQKSGELENSLSQGKHLQSDLAFMISRSEELALRLETAIRSGRTMSGNMSAGVVNEAEMVRDTMPSEGLVAEERNELSQSGNNKGKSKSDLLKALQGMR